MTGENIKSILGDNASRLQELIIDWIRRGEFKIGSKLPSQNELVKIFSCSETTVHKAMQSLCKKGIIYRQIGKGTFLRQLPPKTESSSRIPYADFPIELNAKTCNKKLNILVFSVLDKKEPP
ncbi:MAG TPA: GntR family transcriptional regulator, partial [Victivallales bacterium]|nr:GntR family transcriptional regulator [Victivallales bacterium]